MVERQGSRGTAIVTLTRESPRWIQRESEEEFPFPQEDKLPEVAPKRNGHFADGDFDFVPDERDQALDATSLYMRDIHRNPMRVEMHEKWGKEIFAGKMALGALAILMGSEDGLSEEDRARVSELLGKKGKFLLKRFHMKIKSTRLRIEKNEYKGEKGEQLRNLDTEFLETVSGNEELAKNMLAAWAINEGEDPEGSEFHQFLNQQIIFADQGIRSFNDLVEANLRLPISVARKHFGVKGMSVDDLTGYGNEGLIFAAADYDVRMGLQFSTYAIWWIKQRIDRRIDGEGGMISMPVNVAKELRRRKREQNGAGDSEDPSLPDILKSGLRVQGVVSLDRSLSTEGNFTLLDVLADQNPGVSNTVLDKISREDVRRILAEVLKEREIRVLQLRLGLSEGAEKVSLEKVGKELGVTRERIRQIEAKALKKLRRSPKVLETLKALAEP